MFSAVFHTPFDPQERWIGADAAAASNEPLVATPGGPIAPPRPRRRLDVRAWLLAILPPLFGFALVVAIWAVLTIKDSLFPTPLQTFWSAVDLLSDPLRGRGPRDPGIGWSLLSSLRRLGTGFGLAAVVGIPLGFLIGRVPFLGRMAAPLVGLLRPVSPLAWLPIGLLVFASADGATTWTLFLCSIWPMIVHTAIGVRRVPQGYLDVARVLDLSELKIITRILLPAMLPALLTGVRRSLGTAWLVIVAAEMLTGSTGIGSWVWNEWGHRDVRHVLVAIFLIGLVGMLLEQMLTRLARRCAYDRRGGTGR